MKGIKNTNNSRNNKNIVYNRFETRFSPKKLKKHKTENSLFNNHNRIGIIYLFALMFYKFQEDLIKT